MNPWTVFLTKQRGSEVIKIKDLFCGGRLLGVSRQIWFYPLHWEIRREQTTNTGLDWLEGGGDTGKEENDLPCWFWRRGLGHSDAIGGRLADTTGSGGYSPVIRNRILMTEWMRKQVFPLNILEKNKTHWHLSFCPVTYLYKYKTERAK